MGINTSKDVLLDMLLLNGGSVVGKQTIKNITTQILMRTNDCGSIWGLKTDSQNHVEVLLLILIAADMFVYECKYSIEKNEVILNLKWDSSFNKFNILNDNCWKVIPEQYLKEMDE